MWIGILIIFHFFCFITPLSSLSKISLLSPFIFPSASSFLMHCALLASLASSPVLLPLWSFCLFDWLLYLLSRRHCGHSTRLFFFFFDTQISLIGRGGGNLGGGGSSGGGWSFHWTACWLTLLPESYGFITFGLEKGSIRRASDDSSALNASHTVPGACGCAVWLVKPDSPNVLLLSRRLPFLYSCCLLGLYFLFLFFSRLLPRGHYSLSSSSYYFYKHYYTVFSWIYTFHIFYPISPPGLSLYLNSA